MGDKTTDTKHSTTGTTLRRFKLIKVKVHLRGHQPRASSLQKERHHRLAWKIV
jgi:hypothetical protein